MARVLFVKESRVRGYVTVGLSEDGESASYTVSKITYSELGSPVRGSELDGFAFERLAEEDENFRALRRALSLLSYGDNSKGALFAKLLRAGFSQSAVRHAVRECEGHGYINEDAQLERKITLLANEKLYGTYYIRARLMRAGYSLSLINSVLDRLVKSEDVNFDLNFSSLCEKMGTETDEERRALAYKYGYKR